MTGKPPPIRTIPVPEGRERLHALGLRLMEGSNNPRGEHWLWPNANPEFVNYFPPGNVNNFVLDDIEAIEAKIG